MKLQNMQLTNLNMINNAVKTAKFKLSQHKVQGENSGLSIFQVARLMDTVKNGEGSDDNSQSISFSLN
ncbi:MAG: hypothetical protein QNK23_10235 [Crocinitomicaceae bacterium]|nr:hypothetical protein [Crocinitomicaceae bacterium]